MTGRVPAFVKRKRKVRRSCVPERYRWDTISVVSRKGSVSDDFLSSRCLRAANDVVTWGHGRRHPAQRMTISHLLIDSFLRCPLCLIFEAGLPNFIIVPVDFVIVITVFIVLPINFTPYSMTQFVEQDERGGTDVAR